jgi:hypothetical protein
MKLSYDDSEFLVTMLAFYNEHSKRYVEARESYLWYDFNRKYNVEITKQFFLQCWEAISEAYVLADSTDVDGEFSGDMNKFWLKIVLNPGISKFQETIHSERERVDLENRVQKLKSLIRFWQDNPSAISAGTAEPSIPSSEDSQNLSPT